MMYGRGYNGINNCFESFGFMHNGIGMLLIFLIVLALVITIFLLFFKNYRHQVDDNVLEELKLKFVIGEISEEEYIKRKKLIET